MKMDKRYTKLLRSLNENKDGHHVHISLGHDHHIMAVHDSKEAGMKYMVMGDGPDGHFLVKTTRKALGKKRVGQFVGSRISRHLDKQPFPHDDGPHYSVHKESVLPSSITPPLAPKEDRDRSDRVRDHELAKRHHERQMTRDPENKKYHLQQASLHSAAEDAGAEVSRIAPGKLRDAANRDFEIKSKKALGESVELDEKAPKIDPKKYEKHMNRNKKPKEMSSTKKALSDISKRADKMSRESVEVSEAHTMVCKDCGDELNKPTTDCKNDCSDPNGSHWVKEYVNETSDAAAASWADSRKKLNKGLKQAVKTRDLALQIDKKIAQSRKVRKESTEVDELAQMVPNKSQLNKDQATKISKLDDELKAMRARMAEETQNEDYELTEEDLPEAWTPSMRRAAARRMKILAPRIKLGIKRSKNRTATKEKLMTRAVRKVKSDLIKKFTKGSSKTDLSAARRADIEKRIAKLGPRIKQLAQKQLPATRRMEADRKRNKNK
tara:strand:- start:3491 stop:4975 length:1485 start_codon:yes stop_codon:yes gene_type:complete